MTLPLGTYFARAFGPPDEAAPPIVFTERYLDRDWQERQKGMGAGWFLGRYFFLLGQGLERFTPCLEAWSFLLPPAKERRIIGSNAYGALLILEDETDEGDIAPVRLLDPLHVETWADRACEFGTLLNHWLPDRRLPYFFDTSVYLEWLKTSGRFLADGEILGIRRALPLGGEMTLDNFTPINIVDYYRATGPVYAKAHAQRDPSP